MIDLLSRLWSWAAKVFTVAALLLAPFALYAVAQAPIEELQGPPQKIFYLHVPLAWVSFVQFGGVALAGICYLFSKHRFWDQLGHGLASAGFLFLSGVLVTGPIWAKPIWGAWWVWEPRLTTTFLLWLLFAAYHLLRLSRGNDGWTARASAILGIFAFADVPIIHMSVLWWRSLHPFPVVMRKGNLGGGLDPSMQQPLWLMTVFLFCLGLGLAAIRSQIRKAEDMKAGYPA